MFKEAFIFVGGVTVGIILGMKLADRKYDERFEDAVNDKIDEIHAEEEARKAAKKRDEQKENLKAKHDYSKIVRDYNDSKVDPSEVEERHESEEEKSNDGDDDENNDDGEEEESVPIEDILPRAENPYEIDDEEFDMDNGNDKKSLYYYDGNRTLVDDTDAVVDDSDAEILLGHGWQDYFDTKDVVYIRNEKVCTDFELVYNQGNYMAD